MESLSEAIAAYHNDKETNNSFWKTFTESTNKHSFLKEHRDYIEKNKLGFGDRAFHYMWFLLLKELNERHTKIKLLEIGVYKGQVISLWALIKNKLKMDAEIYAITPLEGNVPKTKIINNKLVRKLKAAFDPEFRRCLKEGNNYVNEDYYAIIKKLFEKFQLSINEVRFYKGYSNNDNIMEAASKRTYDVIYIDGDHSFEGASGDIKNYSKLVKQNGYLVMDDASFFLEGDAYWKGHKEVSKASEIIENLGFKNILNIGHNRVYQKL